MTTTLRNAANSTAGTNLTDADLTAQLLVTGDGFYFGHTNPVVLSGGQAVATIAGQVVGGTATGGVGLSVSGGGDTLTVEGSGLISGDTAVKAGAADTIMNIGTISGGSLGIEGLGGDLTVENHGTLRATTAVKFFSSDTTQSTLINTGSIVGKILGGTGIDTLTNSGTINGAVDLGDGYNTITNNDGGKIFGLSNIGGTQAQVVNVGYMAGIKASGSVGSGGLFITNHGTIIGGVDTAGQSLTLNNTGKIDYVRLDFGNVVNGRDGVVHNNVSFSNDGYGVLENHGRIGANVSMGDGGGVISNDGMIGYSVNFGAANDAYMGANGFVQNANMGGGDDTFYGGKGTEIVVGGLGNDTADLGAGNDYFIASTGSDGDDVLDGGEGLDTYRAYDASARVTIDLESESATGTSIGSDEISNFENAAGSNFNDVLIGTDGANVLDGWGGDDILLGQAGLDRIKGWGGNDKIVGGLGRDVLTGGDGTDTFKYTSLAESTIAGAGRDTILDFTPGSDKIDLKAIDGSKTAAGDQAFSFIGTSAFSGIAGQLHYAVVNGYTVVSGDVNGDKIADFAINLNGTPALTVADFVL